MPNTHGQVTDDDFKAPEGKTRIMREEMSDGKLSIVADFDNCNLALVALHAFREDTELSRDVFTLCNENGPLENY